MPDRISGLDLVPDFDPASILNVHVQHDPTGLFEPTPVKIQDYLTVVGAQDSPVGDGDDPFIGEHAPERVSRRGKIEGGPGRSFPPRALWPPGERPDFAGLEGELHGRLLEIRRDQGLDSPIEGIPE